MSELDNIIQNIRAKLPDLKLLENEPMSSHCSFRIGGPARVIVLPASVEETVELCHILRRWGQNPLVIGNGTNLLVTDRGLDRVVIKMSEGMSRVTFGENGRVSALCGISLARLARGCAERSLTGLEFAHGIPGTLGGAILMNAGAYGGEMKDVIRSVTFLDEELNLVEKPADELEFSYRSSYFEKRNCVILGCSMELRPGVREEISARMRELSEKRRASQPLDMPSAGSTFKRPKTGYAAALIDGAGLRGYSCGGAQVSEKHAGFVVNCGGATSKDVLDLMAHVQKTIYEKYGVMLEPEVRIISK